MGGGILFRFSPANQQWTQIATVSKRPLLPYLSSGYFSVTEQRITFFSIPDQNSTTASMFGVPQEAQWLALGQPLFMARYDLPPKPLGPKDPEAQVPPEVSIRISKRHPQSKN